MAAMAGNKPAQFFYFRNMHDANSYVFDEKDYNVSMIPTYKKDWELMGPWNGAYIYGGISFGIENPDVSKEGLYIGYGINISSHIYPYNKTEDDALQRGDVEYFKKVYKSGIDKNGKRYWINYHIEHHGQENYPCKVYETITPRGIHTKTYVCYKYNKEKTKAKRVVIEFIYTHSPNLPKRYERLAKEYTYEDLLKRGKRVLESLYIKDGWDE